MLIKTNSADSSYTVAKSALSFLSGTALSRISGLARDMSMAFFFGTSPSIAAFLVALRLANLLRRIFGEGALLNSFIPHFESYRNDNPKQAAEFFRDTFFSLIFFLSLFIGGLEIILYFSKTAFALSPENQQILQLIMIILPGTLFICLFSICSALLHCEKFFFLSGISPLAYNSIWIAAVLIFRHHLPEKAATGLSLGITLAFLAQWFITLPKTISLIKKHLSWKEIFQCHLFSLEIRNMFYSLSLGIIGVTAAQINTAVDTLFARFASLEGPAYLNYAIHLQQLPLALFGIGISSALLPPLSRAIKSNRPQEYNQLLEFSLSIALLLIIPCTIAIYAVGGSCVNFIFGRGNFDQASTYHTILCLWGYGCGLLPMVVSLLLAPAFYAMKDYHTPMLASLFSILVNLALNILFVCFFHLGPESLALSTSLAAFCNAGMLYRGLSQKTSIAFSSSFFYSTLNTTVCAGLAGIVTLFIGYGFLNDPTLAILWGLEVGFMRDFSDQLFQFVGQAFAFCSFFILFAVGFKNKQLSELIQKMPRKKKSSNNDEF